MSTLGIGQLAKRAGVAIDTVRYYEQIGNGLRKLIAACPGDGRAEDCPILNALSQEASS